jgi:hypothetical protein
MAWRGMARSGEVWFGEVGVRSLALGRCVAGAIGRTGSSPQGVCLVPVACQNGAETRDIEL